MLQGNVLKTYLDKYLEVSTGGRVKFYEQMTINSATANRFFRFKCTFCQDNWNVASNLFFGDNQTLIPTELTDWVEKHAHVCTKFNNPPATSTGVCQSCGWPFHKHKQAQPVFNDATGTWTLAGKPIQFSELSPVPEPETSELKVKTVKEIQGRKFR